MHYIVGCDFIKYDTPVKFEWRSKKFRGEIDVIGLDSRNNTIYICEVATHTGGLQYTKDNRPNNINKIIDKFERAIGYFEIKYKGIYKGEFQFWCPILRNSKAGSLHNQVKDIEEIKKTVRNKWQIELNVISDARYMQCIYQLRDVARREKGHIKTPVMRFMQIEENSARRLKRRESKVQQLVEK